jgi:hypothetical protein
VTAFLERRLRNVVAIASQPDAGAVITGKIRDALHVFTSSARSASMSGGEASARRGPDRSRHRPSRRNASVSEILAATSHCAPTPNWPSHSAPTQLGSPTCSSTWPKVIQGLDTEHRNDLGIADAVQCLVCAIKAPATPAVAGRGCVIGNRSLGGGNKGSPVVVSETFTFRGTAPTENLVRQSRSMSGC